MLNKYTLKLIHRKLLKRNVAIIIVVNEIALNLILRLSLIIILKMIWSFIKKLLTLGHT